MSAVRDACRGLPPLTGRLLPWQEATVADHARLTALLDEYGSPVNLLATAPMVANAQELLDVAHAAGVDLAVYVARKANKGLAFVDEARRAGLGVDLASERELAQALDRGMPGDRMVMTAAVKPRALLDLAVRAGVTVVLDNADETARLWSCGGRTAALRLAPDIPGRPPTRFGFTPQDALATLADHPGLAVDGLHFHLDGYDAGERVTAIDQALALADELTARGHAIGFLDIGGGIPMSYLDDGAEWDAFWQAHHAALLGDGPPVTAGGHALGLHVDGGAVRGTPNVYPYHQAPTRGPWLTGILHATLDRAGGTVAEALRARGLQLRCEPGRALLDGCGLTAARVTHRKRRRDGAWLVALEMNRTQCRSTSDDFLVDPLLVRPDGAAPGEPIDAHLVGAYCVERELLSLRRMRFPHGVAVDDVVVFPNTAGYLMHILESSSHQIPLARNLVVAPDGTVTPDPIDSV